MPELPLDTIILGDCLDVLKGLPDACLDSIVTDPPYGLGNKEPTGEEIVAYLRGERLDTGGDFMGKKWELPSVEIWKECFRVLKPGGHLLSFAGSRTLDLMGMSIRVAGFEARDTIANPSGGPNHWAWVQGQGFPKSLRVDRALSEHGAPKDVVEKWKGYGTALKPSWEIVWVFRKPLDFRALCDRIGSCLSKLLASFAENNSRSNQPEPSEVYGSAPKPVEPKSATRAGSSVQTDTLPSEWGTVLNLNIVSSWQLIWDDLSALSKTSTIETDVELTTALRTLNSYLWRITPGYIPVERTTPDGLRFLVASVAESFDAVGTRLNVIRGLSAQGNATESAPQLYPAGAELNQPSLESVLVFRKPLSGTVAANVLEHGTGGLNIDGCRVKHASPADLAHHQDMVERIKTKGGSMANSWKNSSDLSGASDVKTEGRWPPNVVLCHLPGCKQAGVKDVPAPVINRFDDGMKPFGNGAGHPYTSSGGGTEQIPVWECVDVCPVKLLDEQSGECGGSPGLRAVKAHQRTASKGAELPHTTQGFSDSGGASRFFPQFPGQEPPLAPFFYTGKATKSETTLDGEVENPHPTRKPLKLMEWLVRLVCPKKVLTCPICTGRIRAHEVSGMREPVYPETGGANRVFDSVPKSDFGPRRQDHPASDVPYVQGDLHSEVQGGEVLLNPLSSKGSGASEPQVPYLRKGISPQGQNERKAEVLFPYMRSTGEEASTQNMPGVQHDVPTSAQEQQSVLLEKVLHGVHGKDETEGSVPDNAGIQGAMAAGSSDGYRQGVCIGTSSSDGTASGEESAPYRGGASSKRGQDRQSDREFGASVESRARQASEAPTQTSRVSTLPGPHSGERTCPRCGAGMIWDAGVVLDPYCGSGTTCVAAVENGMHFIGIEKDPVYHETAQKRVGIVHEKRKEEDFGRDLAALTNEWPEEG